MSSFCISNSLATPAAKTVCRFQHITSEASELVISHYASYVWRSQRRHAYSARARSSQCGVTEWRSTARDVCIEYVIQTVTVYAATNVMHDIAASFAFLARQRRQGSSIQTTMTDVQAARVRVVGLEGFQVHRDTYMYVQRAHGLPAFVRTLSFAIGQYGDVSAIVSPFEAVVAPAEHPALQSANRCPTSPSVFHIYPRMSKTVREAIYCAQDIRNWWMRVHGRYALSVLRRHWTKGGPLAKAEMTVGSSY